MSKEYKVLQFRKGDYQDDHGNYWCDMALEGVGEPVRIVVKDPLKYEDGMTLYGRIEDKTSRAGKPYMRFYKEERPEETAEAPAKKWVDNSDGQRQGMCLNNAASYINAHLQVTDKPRLMGPVEWAERVHEYGTALYLLSDLTNSGSQGDVTSQLETQVEKSQPAANRFQFKKDSTADVEDDWVPSEQDLEEPFNAKEELNKIGF